MGYYLKISLYHVFLVILSVYDIVGNPVGSGLPPQDTIRQITLLFPFGSSEIDSVFMDNAQNLTDLHNMMSNPTVTSNLDSIIITGISSPEGSYIYNLYLAKKRAESLMAIMEKYPDIAGITAKIRIDEKHWERFIEMVREDPDIPGRDTLLKEIENPDLSYDAKSQCILTMMEGETLRYLNCSGILPSLRAASIVAYLYCTPAETETETEIITDKVVNTPVSEIRKGGAGALHLVALRTNILLDIAGGPNIGVEIPIGNHFSVAAVFDYAHTTIKNLYALQTIDGSIEGRYWFNWKDQPLTGWNAGIYGTLGGRYDIQWKDGVQGDRFWTAGMTGGYSLPISQNFNLDFSLAAGVIGTPEARYYERPRDGHLIWKETRYDAIRFSITKVRVNFVWLINTSKKTAN